METIKQIEQNEKPKYRIIFSRHGERLPSGELRPDGIERSKKRGKKWKDEAEVLKGYSSDNPSKRAFLTADISSTESKIKSPLTDKQYKTHEDTDLQYNVFEPDLKHLLKEGKDLIEETTLKEAGLSTERDENGKLLVITSDLSKEEQLRVAPIRQENQKLAFEYVLNNPEGSHRLAMCLAHQLISKIKVLDRYKNYRKKNNQEPEKDVILNNVGHGIFAEALLQEAGVDIVDGEKIEGIDLKNPKNGGYLNPSESFEFEIDESLSIPDLIPLKINRNDGSSNSGIYLDLKKMESLDKDYKEWKESREEKKE
jgi:hypothetical protein